MMEVQQREPPELTNLYAQIRAYTEQLCQPLAIEDYVPQLTVEASPPKWNIAHTTWFFEEMILKPFVSGYRVFHPNFGFLFNSYYNSLGARTRRDQRALSRPTVTQVFAYRRYVDEAMRAFIQTDLTDEVIALITLGLHHEQQHQELLLTDLKYSFSCNPTWPVYETEPVREELCNPIAQGWVELPAGIYGIGFADNHHGEFCFDNERARHQVLLEDISLSNQLVTNAEFLEFMADGGYEDFRLWHAEGWDWVQQQQITAPLYWQQQEGQWMNYSLAGLREVKPQAPVCHVSFYEAAAFAEWKQSRLPTEFEWEAAADQLNWGLRWEWTNSAYLPYPRFRPAAGAVGEYNGKFMVNQMVLRGASVITPPYHSRKTYRNFFHPPERWQFTGIRLAR
jgi:ergothioneine biosynthesis protein EgtB